MRTSTYDDHTVPLAGMSDEEIAAVRRRARRRDHRLVGLSQSPEQPTRGILLEADPTVRLEALARILRERLAAGRCAAARASEVSVHLRLGDQLDASAALRNPFDPHGIAAAGRGFRALAGPIARHACGAASDPPIALVAVLNYSPHKATHSFAWSAESAGRSMKVAKNLSDALDACGVRYRWLSRADTDADLCHMLTSEHFVPSFGGLSALVQKLREIDARARPGAASNAQQPPPPAWNECTLKARRCLECAIAAEY